ncbi:MAG: GNAT family N-acetyltransferase [Cyclobacteriaceae bacterium]
MSQIEIRRAQNSDFEDIYTFICELENETFDRDQQKRILEESLLNIKNVYLVASINQELVGFLSCHVQNLLHRNGPVGEIQEMFISAEKRNLGIGKILIDHLKIISKENHFIQLEVTSNLRRKLAHNFYEKQGFIFTHKKFVFKDRTNHETEQ